MKVCIITVHVIITKKIQVCMGIYQNPVIYVDPDGNLNFNDL